MELYRSTYYTERAHHLKEGTETKMMIQTIETQSKEVEVANTVEVVGENLVVNVKRSKLAMFLPTMKISLDHVLGAEADPQIERKLWRAWALGVQSKDRVPEPGVKFYNPRHFCAHKAVVIRLKDEVYERLVVEVQDPEGAVARINEAVGASSRLSSVA